MPAFTVTNQDSGRVFGIRNDETVLDAALRHGFSLPYSCRNGTCAACMADLIEGEVKLDPYDKTALSDAQLESSKILLCRTRPQSDLVISAGEVEALDSISIQTLPCRVSSLTRLTHDVMDIALALPRDTVFNYIAGQYIDIILRDGRRRGFSIAAAPRIGGDLHLQVRQVPNGRFTTQIFKGMKVRDILRFEGPLGTFFLRDSAKHAILIGGGTGFAPLNAMIEAHLAAGEPRPLHLFWGVRTERDFYHLDRIENWQDAWRGTFQFTPVISEPGNSKSWQGATGWIHDAVLECYPDLSGHQVYASGPPPMIEAIRGTFAAHRLAEDDLFYDSFEFSSDSLYAD